MPEGWVANIMGQAGRLHDNAQVGGTAPLWQGVTQALADNKGRIRSAIGKGLGIRLTPSIEFIPDAIPEGAAQIEDLLAQAKQRDAELAAAAAGAVHAGEADPYKRREDGELEDLDEDDDPEDDDVAADEPATAPAVSSPTAQD